MISMKQTSRGFAPLLIVLVLALIGFVAYNVFRPRSVPTPSPSPTPTQDPTASWKTYTSDYCGTSNPKTKFSISIPSNWNSTVQEDKIWAKHSLSGEKGEKFTVICGIGFGGGCDPKDKKEIKIGNKTQLGCYGEQEGRVYLSQVGAQAGEVGVTIEADFPNDEESKEILNKILSTFRFID